MLAKLFELFLDTDSCLVAMQKGVTDQMFSSDSQKLPCLHNLWASSIDACQETCNCFDFNRQLLGLSLTPNLVAM